jgi:hypothetical protein
MPPDENLTVIQKLAEIQRLAGLPEVEYGFERAEAAKRLGLPRKILDAAVHKLHKKARASGWGEYGSYTRTGSAQTLGREGVDGCTKGCTIPPPVRIAEELYESSRDLIEAPDILSQVDAAIKGSGYAGDTTVPVLAYVVVSSRLQDRPIKLHLVGPAAAGKNHAIATALALIPDGGVFQMTASSPKALIYTDVDFRHKTIILSECDSLVGLVGNAASLVRSIIEDSRTIFDVVEKDPETGHYVTRRVIKDGPTGLITTGVRELEFQLGTRMLVAHLSDSPEQTAAVLRAEAAIAEGHGPQLDADARARFHDFQHWLEVQPTHEVIVPFAALLADLVPTAEVRMRRDFKQLLALVKAIALLNRHHREHHDGVILANLDDYEWGRRLILSSFKSLVGGGITDAVRETCLAVPEGTEVSEADLARDLNVSKNTISYRVRKALNGGWLANREDRKGYAYRLVRGAPLPADDSPLPTAQQLKADPRFVHPPFLYTHSYSPQPLGGVRRNEQVYKCTKENQVYQGARENQVEVEITDYSSDDDPEGPAR